MATGPLSLCVERLGVNADPVEVSHMSASSPPNRLQRFSRALVWSLTAVTASLLGSATGCVEDVGLVDRTAPYKLDKTMFDGVWMYMQTTIDAPYSSAVSFAALAGPPFWPPFRPSATAAGFFVAFSMTSVYVSGQVDEYKRVRQSGRV